MTFTERVKEMIEYITTHINSVICYTVTVNFSIQVD